MKASDSETNAYYNLESQRDFEDFCDSDIPQTVEGSRPRSDWQRRRWRCRCWFAGSS